eukprot:4118633-Ditylum_brightwellii.AAC.1
MDGRCKEEGIVEYLSYNFHVFSVDTPFKSTLFNATNSCYKAGTVPALICETSKKHHQTLHDIEVKHALFKG